MEHITLNGQKLALNEPLTVQELLLAKDYSPDNVAVAINLQFVPRSQFSSQQLTNYDQVEILSAIQGG